LAAPKAAARRRWNSLTKERCKLTLPELNAKIAELAQRTGSEPMPSVTIGTDRPENQALAGLGLYVRGAHT